MSRGERFSRGVLWGLCGQAAAAVASLLLLPRIVRGFGEETYGVFLLMQAAAGWVMLMHLGAGMGVVRALSEARASGRWGEARASLRLAAALQGGGSLAAALLLWLAAPLLAGGVFDLPADLRRHGVWLIRVAAVSGIFGSASFLAGFALQGLQRYGLMSLLSAAPAVLVPVGTCAALALGRGLGAVAAWFGLVHAACATAGVLLVLRLLPPAPREAAGSPSSFLRYCLVFWPGAAAQFVSGQLDRVFVAGLRGLVEFTLYSVPVGLLQRAQTFPAMVGAVLLPMIGEASAAGPREVERIYLRCTRLLLALLAPLYVLLFALMPQFLSLWLGGRFGDEAAWPARLMVLAYALAAMGQTAYAVAAARGGGAVSSAAAWLQAALSLLLWPFLIPRWGLVGAAAGALAAQAAASAAFLGVVHSRMLGLGAGRYARQALAPAASASLILLAVAWPLREHIGGWPSFLSLVVGGCALYAAAVWRLLPPEDRDFLSRRAGLAGDSVRMVRGS